MRDSASNMIVKVCIAPDEGAGSNTAKTGTGIDLANADACTFVIATGALVDADATFTVLIEDSPDNSTWTAVADEFLIGTEAGASFQFDDDTETRKIGYIGNQRYARCVITPANNTGAWDITALAILSRNRVGPQSSQAA